MTESLVQPSMVEVRPFHPVRPHGRRKMRGIRCDSNRFFACSFATILRRGEVRRIQDIPDIEGPAITGAFLTQDYRAARGMLLVWVSVRRRCGSSPG